MDIIFWEDIRESGPKQKGSEGYWGRRIFSVFQKNVLVIMGRNWGLKKKGYQEKYTETKIHYSLETSSKGNLGSRKVLGF